MAPINDRDTLKLILAGAALLCAVLFGISRLYTESGHVAPPQGDSLIFYQYARAMAEGHPYRYQEDAPPTTGSTSHLYPMLLALPYALGAKGDALVTVGFLLNACFYLALVVLVFLSARRMLPSSAPLAAALAALSGQTMITMFGQTDMGLFTTLAVASFCAALYRRYILLAVLLILCTVTRPEGAVLSVLMIVASFMPTARGKRGSVGFTFAGAMGLFAYALIAFFNHRMTGSVVPISVIGKGLSVTHTPAGVLMSAATAIGTMFKEVFFGLTDGHRRFYLLPVFGGWLGVMGLLSRRWRRDETTRVESWWMAAFLVTVAMISVSGWEGIQYDRYLAWILPVWFIYVAIGLRQVAGMFPWRRAYMFMSFALLLYQGLGLAYLGSVYAYRSAALASNLSFVRSVGERLPDGARIGLVDFVGLAYYLPDHPVSNLWGVISPEFVNETSPRMNIEVLKHEPETRFDTWILFSGQETGLWFSVFAGRQLAAEPPLFGRQRSLALYEADWSTLNLSTLPLSSAARQFVYGLGVVDQVNVGYPPHEERADYRQFTRLSGVKLMPVSETLALENRQVTETGRVVMGSETMRIKAEPGREMRVVLRTSRSAGAVLSTSVQPLEFASPITLTLQVDGKDAGSPTVNLNGPGEFTEAVFRIPGELITSNSIELTVGGDHISYAYWFYQ